MLKAVEDRPTPKEVYNWRVYFVSTLAAFGAFMFGYDAGFLGGTIALPAFANAFFTGGVNGADPLQSANVVSTYQLGAIIGALAAYPISERYGRRAGIFFAGFMNVIGTILELLASPSTGLGIFYAGRVLGGVGVGAVSMVVPIYIAEIAPTAIRGRLVGFYELSLQCGGLVGFWIPYGVNQSISATSAAQWRIPVGLQLVPAGIIVLTLPLLTESPRWLLKRNNVPRATKNLVFLRNLPADHPYIVSEISRIQEAIALEMGAAQAGGRNRVLKEISLRGNRNRLAIGMILMAFQNLTGINAINYYSPTIFKALGISGTSTGLFSTGIFGVVKAVCTLLFCFFVVDHVPRRLIFMSGAVGGALAMFYVGGYVAIAKPTPTKDLGSGGISAIAMIYVYAVFYCFSWNGLPWVYVSEIYPITIRGVCMALTAVTQWVFQFAIARATPFMIVGLGYGTYLFFGSWMIIMVIWTYFFIRETKGVTLEEMDELFGLVIHHRDSNTLEKSSTEHIEKKKDSVDTTNDIERA